MIGAMDIDIEQKILGLGAEANAVEGGALLKDAIAQWVARFGLPFDFGVGGGVCCPNEVIAMGKEAEKRIALFHRLKRL